jgi:hypothetical protein
MCPIIKTSTRSIVMSAGSVIVLSGVILAFMIFATVLLWGDLYSHDVKQ